MRAASSARTLASAAAIWSLREPELRGLQIGFQLRDPLAILIPYRPRPKVFQFGRRAGSPHESFLAGKFLFRQGECGAGLFELRFEGFDLGGTLAFLDILESGSRLGQLALRFIPRGLLGSAVQLEQRCACLDLRPASNLESLQRSGQRRGDVDELSFDVSLQHIAIEDGCSSRRTSRHSDDLQNGIGSGLPAWMQDHHSRGLPVCVSTPSRITVMMAENPVFGVRPSSVIFPGLRIAWTDPNRISVMSGAAISFRIMPAFLAWSKNFPK